MNRSNIAFWLLVIGAILLVYPRLKQMYDTKSVGSLDAPTVGTLMTAAGLVLHYGKIKSAIV